MPSDYRFSDLLTTAGQTTGEFMRDLGNTVANGYCSLYKNYPGFIVGAPGDPITPFRRGLADSLCGGRSPGLPSAPTSQFSGGQCPGGDYNVNFTAQVQQLPNGTPFTWNSVANVYGPVRGLRPGNLDTDQSVVYVVGSNPAGTVAVESPVAYGLASLYRILSCSITSITRRGGLPDNCGDPPFGYPSVVPPDAARKPTVTVPVPSGLPNVAIPLVYAPISANAQVTVNVNATVPIDLVFDFRGLTIKFGSDGTGGSTGFLPSDRSLLQQTSSDATAAKNNSSTAANNAANANTNAAAANTNALGAKNSADAAKVSADAAKVSADAAKVSADAAKKNTDPKPPKTDPSITANQLPPGSKTKDAVAGLQYVDIIVTTLPYKNKIQFGDGAPNVYYAGWFEWRYSTGNGVRTALSFATNTMVAPKEATGYAYTFTNGANGYAIEYTKTG